MKKFLMFNMDGLPSLEDTLRIGLAGYSIEKSQAGRPTSLWLHICDSTVLRIQATVTTVGSWHEIGTLVLQLLAKGNVPLEMTPLASAWSYISRAEKLMIEEDEFQAESGLAIYNQAGEKFLILAGAFPHAVEISAPFYPGDFQPEYDITTYKRVPIQPDWAE